MKLISKEEAVARWKSLKIDLKKGWIKFEDYIVKKRELKKSIKRDDLS